MNKIITCALCGYQEAGDFTGENDVAHDNLCCGVDGDCTYTDEPEGMCALHYEIAHMDPAFEFVKGPTGPTVRHRESGVVA